MSNLYEQLKPEFKEQLEESGAKYRKYGESESSRLMNWRDWSGGDLVRNSHILDWSTTEQDQSII